MIIALLVFHAFVAIALIGLVLLQKGDGSGPFGVGGGQNALFTARGVANILTRATSILAALFIGNCILIGTLTNYAIEADDKILGKISKKAAKSEKTSEEKSADEPEISKEESENFQEEPLTSDEDVENDEGDDSETEHSAAHDAESENEESLKNDENALTAEQDSDKKSNDSKGER